MKTRHWKSGPRKRLDQTVIKTFNIELSMDEQISEICEQRGMSKSSFIRYCLEKELKTEQQKGFIYLAKESLSGKIKIGHSKDPKRRIEKDLSVTKLPFELELIHTFESKNSVETEKLLQEYFQAQRYTGEWFVLSDEEILWVRNGIFPPDIMRSIYIG